MNVKTKNLGLMQDTAVAASGPMCTVVAHGQSSKGRKKCWQPSAEKMKGPKGQKAEGCNNQGGKLMCVPEILQRQWTERVKS